MAVATESRLTIVIVGGVAGGASAATRARRLNEEAEIILFEKDEHVSFANCGLPYYLGGEITDRSKLVVASADLLRTRFRLDVRTRQEVTRIDRANRTVTVQNHLDGSTYEQRYSKLILAPGASAIVPPLKGVGAPNVLTLRNLNDADRIAAAVRSARTPQATVVGAGFIGLELVEQLTRRGLAVSLVEGWRGEICHAALTDGRGRLAHYKVVDPSFHNWFGLACALRNQQISDFPLCNKSFNLSYCGFDL